MSEGKIKATDGRALWLQARTATLETLSEQSLEVDASDLAAYLDGNLDEADRARVEAALAASPRTQELLIASRESLDAGPLPAPDSVVERARGLVGRPASRPERVGRLFADLVRPWLPQRSFAFATVAAAFILASVAGFELGRAEGDYNAEVDHLIAAEVSGILDQGGEELL